MIRDTSGQDRPLSKPTVGRPWRRWVSGGALAIALLAGIGYVVRGWLGAERSADRSRLRIATVERGTRPRASGSSAPGGCGSTAVCMLRSRLIISRLL